MHPVSFTQRLTKCNFNIDDLESDDEDILDELNEQVMNDPRTMGEFTFDAQTIRDWINTCQRENKEITNPKTRELIHYDLNEDFDKQFPKNRQVEKRIDNFVKKKEKIFAALHKEEPKEKEISEKEIPSHPEPVKTFEKIEKFDERFDFLKDFDIQKMEIPFLKIMDDEKPGDGEAETSVGQIDEIKFMFGGGSIWFHPSNVKEGLENVFFQMINAKSNKMPILQFTIKDFKQGICTYYLPFIGWQIIKINPAQLLKIEESLNKNEMELELITSELIDEIISEMNKECRVIPMKFSPDKKSYKYLLEVLDLWNRRHQEKFDLTNMEDVKLALFNAMFRHISIEKIFTWDGAAYFVAKDCTSLELRMFRERLIEFLDVYYECAALIEKNGLESMILGLNALFATRHNECIQNGVSFALTFKEVWTTCFVFFQPNALQMAQSLCKTHKSLNNYLPKMMRVIESVPELADHVSEVKIDKNIGFDFLLKALVKEFVIKWNLFKTLPPSEDKEKQLNLKVKKLHLLEHILQGYIKLIITCKETPNFEIFSKQFKGLSEIQKDLPVSIHFFESAVEADTLLPQIKSKAEALGILHLISFKGYVVCIHEDHKYDEKVIDFMKGLLDLK